MNAVYKSKIEAFLQVKSIAVLGYSSQGDQPANAIYKKLKNNGYQVFAVNPKAEQIKDVPCYPEVKSIPGPVQGAVLCTPASATEQAVKDCAECGINQLWMHTGMGPGSYDPKAFETAKKLGMEIIPGGCPMMYVKPDIVHKCMGWLKKLPE
jgi:predicted CoA-binding protein